MSSGPGFAYICGHLAFLLRPRMVGRLCKKRPASDFPQGKRANDTRLQQTNLKWQAKLKEEGRGRAVNLQERLKFFRAEGLDVSTEASLRARLSQLAETLKKQKQELKQEAETRNAENASYSSDVQIVNDFIQYVSLRLAAGAKDACAQDRYVSVETGISRFDAALRSQTPELSLTPKAKGIKNKAAIVNESMGRTVPRCRAVQLGQFHKVYDSG